MRRTPFYFLSLTCALSAAEPRPLPNGNRLLADYLSRQVGNIENQPIPVPADQAQWKASSSRGRQQVAEMLGLGALEPRQAPQATCTGTEQVDGVIIEKLHYQSRPGLYVTGNLYRPADQNHPLPAILYVCGHSDMRDKQGNSLGNKSHYQHHGAWFARHGYVCLTIDTVQLGEIRGEHQGTYRLQRWWWVSRGYTPAGVEAWNGLRGIDYLVSRPEVDPERIGVTGRSGGGAYTWWIAALDERVKVAAPTAGITTLRNHVVDGAVEGHCDCMYMVNRYRWDYDRVAALVAPRPLLICNTDKDPIFPLDGVYSVYSSVRKLYRELGAEGKVGLQIAEGPHKDTQPLNTGAFAWFERWLKGADPMATFDDAARQVITPEKLRVFSQIPADERNTRIDEEFVPIAVAKVPATEAAWTAQRDTWMTALRHKVFGAWPAEPDPLNLRFVGKAERHGITLQAWDFDSQQPYRFRLWLASRSGLTPAQTERIVLHALNGEEWTQFAGTMVGQFPSLFEERSTVSPPMEGFAQQKQIHDSQSVASAWIAVRGIGPTAWSGSDKQMTQYLRRFYLLGQTLDGMQVYDLRRAIAALRQTAYARVPLWLEGSGVMGCNALYASLFEPDVARVELRHPTASHRDGPYYLGVMKDLDLPQAVTLAASRSHVVLHTEKAEPWAFATESASALKWSSLEILGD